MAWRFADLPVRTKFLITIGIPVVGLVLLIGKQVDSSIKRRNVLHYIDVQSRNISLLSNALNELQLESAQATGYLLHLEDNRNRLEVQYAGTDAAMQALGSYERGIMLFLGLGTGLGSALVVEGVVVPMELAHLPYKKGTYEYYLGKRALERLGKKKWREYVELCVSQLIAALQLDDVVLGGGQVKVLKELPAGCRAGQNSNAFAGGFRLWEPGREHFSRVA